MNETAEVSALVVGLSPRLWLVVLVVVTIVVWKLGKIVWSLFA